MKKIIILIISLLLIASFSTGCKEADEQTDDPDIQASSNGLVTDDQNLPTGEQIPAKEANPTEDDPTSKSETAVSDGKAIPKEETKAASGNTTSKENTEKNETQSKAEGEKVMPNGDRLTKEEFLSYIEKNNTGLSADDFAGIDVDDFLDYTRFTAKSIETSNIKNMFESYKRKLKDREFDPYRAKEIASVKSSDKEYDSFKKAFFDLLDAQIEYVGKNHYLADIYQLTFNDRVIRLSIGRTQDFDSCEFYTYPDGTLGIREIPDDDSPYSYFLYNKNKKYYLLTSPILDINKAFSELGD
jgi:hypothetical protein